MARGKVYNKVYTPEKWELVNKENKDIIEDFLTEYKQQKKSENTIKQYFNDLRLIAIKIMEDFDNKSFLEMTKKDFRKLNLNFDEMDLSPARCNRLHSAVNSLLTFVEDDDDYDYEVNQSKKVKGVPNVKVKTNEDDFFFTFDEFIQVRDKLVEQGDLQNAVMWSLAFDSAGRRNEIFQVKKQGLLDGNKTNVVIGKRGKQFPLVYLNDTKELIRQYLEQRGDDDIDSLWICGSGENKRPAAQEVLYNRMTGKINDILSDIRGEETNIFFHSCRHSRIESLQQGTDDRLKDENGNNRKYPIEQIQVMAHHSDLSTTAGYLKNHDEDTINEMFGF